MNPSRCPAVDTTPSAEDWVKDQLRQIQARMQAKKPHLPCWLMGEWSATLADLPVQHITFIDDGSYTRTGKGLDGDGFHSIGSWRVEGDTLVWFHATHSGPDIPAPQQLVREGSSKDRFHLRHQDGSLTRFELKKWVGSVGCRR